MSFNKKVRCIQLLSTSLLSLKKGDKLKTIDYYVNKGFSRGIIHMSIKEFITSNAIEVNVNGRNGTFLKKINYRKVFDMSGLKSVIATMPLPHSKRYQVLATAINSLFKNKNIPFELLYKRGSVARSNLLDKNHTHFTLVSKLAAKKLIEKNKDLEIVFELGLKSWTKAHIVIFSNPNFIQIENKMRIGCDFESWDMRILTKMVTKGKQVKLIDIKYNSLANKLKSKIIDAVVFNSEEIYNFEKFNKTAIIKKEAESLEFKNSTIAVFLINKKNENIKNILLNVIKIDQIKQAIERIGGDDSLIDY